MITPQRPVKEKFLEQLITLCFEAWCYATQTILCSFTQFFHLMFQGKTGKPPHTDSHSGNHKHVKLVTHFFFATCTGECCCSGSLYLNDFVYFLAENKNGIPANVCDLAAPHHTGHAIHCNHGEGNSRI